MVRKREKGKRPINERMPLVPATTVNEVDSVNQDGRRIDSSELLPLMLCCFT